MVIVQDIKKKIQHRLNHAHKRYDECINSDADYYRGQIVAYETMQDIIDELELSQEKLDKLFLH